MRKTELETYKAYFTRKIDQWGRKSFACNTCTEDYKAGIDFKKKYKLFNTDHWLDGIHGLQEQSLKSHLSRKHPDLLKKIVVECNHEYICIHCGNKLII